MGDLECDFMKVKLTEWETLDTDGEKFVYGRLKALEDLALHIEVMRESLTRLLVTNTGGRFKKKVERCKRNGRRIKRNYRRIYANRRRS